MNMRRPRTAKRIAPVIECLEERQLLSYVPAAPAFRVNQVVDGGQFAQQVATRPGGEATAVWFDYGLDSDGAGVYARRINSEGVPDGNQFRVNTRVEGDQASPVIGADAVGNTDRTSVV